LAYWAGHAAAQVAGAPLILGLFSAHGGEDSSSPQHLWFFLAFPPGSWRSSPLLWQSLYPWSARSGGKATEARGGNRSKRPEFRREEGASIELGVIFDLVIIISLVVALWTSKRFSFRAGFFPWAAGFHFSLLPSLNHRGHLGQGE